MAEKLNTIDFDYLIGPEVKVVPLLYALSEDLHKDHFIVCRKSIKGYMTTPLVFKTMHKSKLMMLVLDGKDAGLLKNKKVIIVDDVVSSGNTVKNLKVLIARAGAQVVTVAAIFRQSQLFTDNLIYLKELPVFTQI